MNKIIPKNFLSDRSGSLRKHWFLIRKYSDKDKEKDEEKSVEDPRLNREKGSKPKPESIQEESYFHKEEVEQLKELKKKLKKKKSEVDDNK